MDCNSILAYVAIGCLLIGDQVTAYFNQTYSVYSFILSNISADTSTGGTAMTYAQDWCRSNGYTLATIPNKEVQDSTLLFIGSAVSNEQMHIAEQIILNGKFYTALPGTWIWVNGQPINGVNIQAQKDPSQLYVYGFLKTSDYRIYASTHNNGRPFVCERPTIASDCVDGLSLNGRCYQRKTSSLNWYSARNECLDGGGDLASFETLSDSTFNSTLGSTLFADASGTEYWVGMQRAEWRWEDTDIAIKYTNWESGSPNNALACFGLRYTSQWLWYTYDCSGTYRFICLATMPTPSTVSSDTSQTKSTTASLFPPISFRTSSGQPTSVSSILPTHASLALPLGLGIGLGMGAILVVVIVVGVIFIRRKQNGRQSDAEREANAGKESTIQQISTLSSTSLASNRSNQNLSPTNDVHFGRSAAHITETYETLQSTYARSTESPYQQLDTSYENLL